MACTSSLLSWRTCKLQVWVRFCWAQTNTEFSGCRIGLSFCQFPIERRLRNADFICHPDPRTFWRLSIKFQPSIQLFGNAPQAQDFDTCPLDLHFLRMRFHQAQRCVWHPLKCCKKGRARHVCNLRVSSGNRIAMISISKQGSLGQCCVGGRNMQSKRRAICHRSFQRN
ncbi:hypothetical protein ROLI_006140 [Roseobacter fucihabitans]|uniref:Secreted protein n=1 Tax=Roseobacter fucihabitans TaxID=1537242 RepID=A0ABZ2BPU1_9RHOB|nr:hypothetical protein [Roseobacter litoralis]